MGREARGGGGGGATGATSVRHLGRAIGGLALLALQLLADSPRLAAGPEVWLERSRAAALRMRTVTGEPLSLEGLLAKGPAVLAFWATWCQPCLAELPEIERLYNKYRDRGLSVVGVSVDGPRNYAKVRPFAAKLGLSFPIVLDEDGKIQKLFQVGAVPTAVVIDTAGLVVTVREGYRPGDTRGLEAEIAKLVSPPTGEAPKQ